jgi:TetR/AcrR family transcriptional repressor of nem operon
VRYRLPGTRTARCFLAQLWQFPLAIFERTLEVVCMRSRVQGLPRAYLGDHHRNSLGERKIGDWVSILVEAARPRLTHWRCSGRGRRVIAVLKQFCATQYTLQARRSRFFQMPQFTTHSKIVKAGFAVFYAHGFNGSSVQDITEAAGIPKGSFYSHFKSKESLALEVLAVYEKLGRLDLLANGSERPLKRLHAHFRFLQQLHETDLSRGCFFGNFTLELAATHPAVRTAIQSGFKRWGQVIATTLREAIGAGDLAGATDADRLSRHLINCWQGAVLQVKLNQTFTPFDDFYFFMSEVLRSPAGHEPPAL